MTNIKVDFWTEGNPNNFPDQLIYRSPNLCQRDEMDFAIDVFYFMYNNHLYYAYANIVEPKNEQEVKFNEDKKREFFDFSQKWMVPNQNTPWRRFWISGKTIKQYYDYYPQTDEDFLRSCLFEFLSYGFNVIYDNDDEEATEYFLEIDEKHPIFKNYGIKYYKDYIKYLESHPEDLYKFSKLDDEFNSGNLSSEQIETIAEENSKITYKAFKEKLGFLKYQFKQDLLTIGRGQTVKQMINEINFENSLFINFDDWLEKVIKYQSIQNLQDVINSEEYKEMARKNREDAKNKSN